MTIIDTNKLYAKLEATGEPEVRKKLAAGAYGAAKIKSINEWLHQKEEDRKTLSESESVALANKSFSWTKVGVIAGVIAAIAAIISLVMYL